MRARPTPRGLICDRPLQAKARRTGSRFKVTPTVYDFSDYWLNAPGAYYWQAHRVHCDHGAKDCLQEGPVQLIAVD